MSFKSILVHLAHDEDHMARLEVAYRIARRFEAHLQALFVTSPVSMPYAIEGRGASASFMRQATEIAHAKAVEVEKELEQWAHKDQASFEMTRTEGDHLKLLSEFSHTADLAIVSQSDPRNLEEMVFAELPDNLALVSSCPVMILPHGQPRPTLSTKPMIAWKPSREAARAVRGALPFLQSADAPTRIVTVGNDKKRHSDLEPLENYLAQHGVRSEKHYLDNRDAGGTLLDFAKEIDTDLIVMGSYGHSRLREIILGGATRKILNETHVPILTAH